MKKIIFKSKEKRLKTCQILIGSGAISEISRIVSFNQYFKVFVITDQNIGNLFLKKLGSVIPVEVVSFELRSGEKEKNIENIEKIWTFMQDLGCDRKTLVVNLGGGVICDMGGFAASTYMRGVDFINIPTTLLAQVDAGIGGKTGFDFLGIKNLIGTFQQPVGVIIDTQFLRLLPRREFISGFAEIVKYGLIKDRRYFEKISKKNTLDFTQDELVDIVYSACKIKAEIVQSDATENGLRKILNFGHTVGHAVEAISISSKSPLLHGEAVSVGMMAEAYISYYLGMLSLLELESIKSVLLKIGLPISMGKLNSNQVLRYMNSDKKNEFGNINLILLNSIGNAIYKQNVPKKIILKSLSKKI